MKPKVLLMTSSFHQGGSERQFIQLARLLHETDRYAVRVACIHREGALRAEVEGLGLGEIPEFPLTSFYNSNAAKQIKRFRSYLRENEIDVVQVFDFYTNVFAMTGAALARVPARIAARREMSGTKTTAQKFVERRAFNLAHTIVANAEAVREELIRDGVPAKKIVTIHNGMDISRVGPRPGLEREAALALLNLPHDDRERRFVTIVANMRLMAKDQATFLRAAKRVRAQLPEAAFVLAGEGELMDGLRAQALELGLQDSTFFIGRCKHVAELLAVSDVCVLSSRSEAFSNSILEYMAAARPVVATDVGGAREAVVENETGFITPPGDEKAMAARITQLLKDPLRARQMGERGLEVVRQKFSCEAQLEHIENLYDRLLARKRTALQQAVTGGLYKEAESKVERS